MSWKTNGRTIPASRMRAGLDRRIECGSAQYVPGERKWRRPEIFARKTLLVKKHGKAFVENDHIRDLFSEDEDGKKRVVASVRLRRGQYLFPTHYLHTKKRFVGKVKDVRHTEARGWEIYIEGVLRSPSTGEPVLFNGSQIDCSGWYLESDLKDAKLGVSPIKSGASLPTESELIESRNRRIRRASR